MHRRSTLLAAALAIGPAPGHASEPVDPTATRDAMIELASVEVTGSHLRKIDLETQHAIQVLLREDLLRTGLTNVGDIVQSLVIANGRTLNRNVNNGGNGEQRVNLRNLGANRTLVLVDGMRWVSELDGAIDIGTIPLALVERIEVFKDGASAIYGSDAIAGVINVITRRDYAGAEFGVHYGRTAHDDGISRALDFSIGRSGEHWNIALGIEYAKDDAIFSRDRAISATPAYGLPLSASGTLYNGYLVPSLGFVVRTPGRPGTSPDDFHAFDPAQDLDFNYQDYTYLQTPLERRAAFARARYEFTPTVAVNADLLLQRRDTAQQLAPAPVMFGIFSIGSDAFTVSADNAYNPFGEEVLFTNRRMLEFGTRHYAQTADLARLHVGIDGIAELAGHEYAWGIDAIGERERVTGRSGPYAYNPHLALAVGPSFLDAEGVAHCGNPDAVVAGCVPVNVFGGPGSMTPAMLDYIGMQARDNSSGDLRDVLAHVSGSLATLPAGSLDMAAGMEYRHDAGRYAPDRFGGIGETNGDGEYTEGTNGQASVREAYLEFNLPLLRDHAFARVLDLTTATRHTDHSVFGGALNSQFGLRWKPHDDVLLRANYAEGFRAPSIHDLFGGARHYAAYLGDPCATHGDVPPPADIAARCAAAGVPEDVSESPAGVEVIDGPNRALQPEASRSRSLGLVWSPGSMAGLELGIDWYDIRLRDAIAGVDPQSYVDDCYARGDVAACAHLQRNADGTLSDVTATQQNQPGGLEVEGYDFSLAYATETRVGAFKLRWDAAYLSYFGELGQPRRGTLLAGGAIADGNVAGDAVNWRLRSVLKLDWKRGAWDATAALRYFSPLTESCGYVITTADTVGDPSLYSLCSDPDRRVDGEYAPANHIASVTYVDLEAGWSAPWKGRLSLGVRNAFNRDPPVSYSASELSTNFIPDYDLPGRWWYVSYRQAF